MDVSSRIIIPLITPFDQDFNIDVDAFTSHVERLYKAGIRYFFPSSSTGELDRLDIEEVALLVNVINDALDDVHIFPGIFSQGVLDAISKIDYLEECCDIDGFIIPTPSYFKYDLDSLYRFYSDILSSTDKQVIIYVIPSNTGVLPDPKLYQRLSERYGNLVGVKITYNDITYLESVLNLMGRFNDRFKVYVGSDLLSLPNLMLGGYGVIPGLGNIIPRLYIEMVSKYLEGKIIDAVKLYRRLAMATHLFDIPYMFPAVVKFALEALELGVKRFVRPPMHEVIEKYRSDVLSILRAYGEFL